MTIKNQQFKRRAMWGHPRLVWRRILGAWPLLLWAIAILGAAFLYQGSTRLTGLMGAVETVIEPVAPLETARLMTINVELGQRVKAGDVVASMDTLLFDADTAVDEAQLIEVEGTLQDYQQRVLEFVSSFEDAKNKAQFETETQVLSQKRDESVLAVLRAELGRLEELKKKGLMSEQDLASLRPDVASLEQTVASYPALIDIHQRRLANATEDETTMKKLLSEDAAGADVRFDILATIREMRKATDAIIRTTREQRKVLRESYVLRAAREGVVSQIFHQPGDVVPAGEPILRLVGEHPERIIGFLPETHLGDLQIGDTIWVWRQTGSTMRLSAKVESIAPEIDTLPGRVSPIRGEPLRGRRVVLTCPDGHDLIPGETLRLQLPPQGWGAWLDGLLAF
ncbi:MAG: HlyD family secretion protein [Lentisphaerae bacterium]|nr:HlyD family secretion protein [Lentisphaerota bacterium]